MESQRREVYFESILKAIELYQRGELGLEELESIPKEDLVSAMREECQRISRVLNEKNKSLSFNFLKKKHKEN